MNQIVEFESEFGPILVEVEAARGGRESVSRGAEKPSKSEKRFEEAIDTVKKVANVVVSKANEIVRGPDEFTVEVGLSFKTEAGVVIAKASTEGNLKITMKWVKPKPEEKSTETPASTETPPIT